MFKKTNKKEKAYAERLIPVICMAVIIYTALAIWIQAKFGMELSPTLTTCYFGFWGVEIVNLAMIKFGKGKKKSPTEFGTYNQDVLNEDENLQG